MDFISLIIWLIIVYIIWTLIETVSSLQEEIREMRLKCIKEVYKNDVDAIENTTKNPKKVLLNKISYFRNYIKGLDFL